MKKISKDRFVREYKDFLDYQIKKVLKEFYPKIKNCLNSSKLYQHERLVLDKEYLTYQMYVLETAWRYAPFAEFFREYNGIECEYKGKVFKLVIEDVFLKTKSKVVFQFVCER